MISLPCKIEELVKVLAGDGGGACVHQRMEAYSLNLSTN